MLLNDFLSLLYPECCAACHHALVKNEEELCLSCLNKLPKIPLSPEYLEPMEQKFLGRLRLVHTLAYLQYSKGSITQQLMKSLKYRNRPEVGRLLGQGFGRHLLAGGLQRTFEAVLPIPLHVGKQRMRGYNQAECFASGMAEVLKIPVHAQLLRRKTATKTQTKLSRLARWQNVADVFELDGSAVELLQHRHLLLVDDVITTGATVEACGAALSSLPGVTLSVAAIASA